MTFIIKFNKWMNYKIPVSLYVLLLEQLQTLWRVLTVFFFLYIHCGSLTWKDQVFSLKLELRGYNNRIFHFSRQNHQRENSSWLAPVGKRTQVSCVAGRNSTINHQCLLCVLMYFELVNLLIFCLPCDLTDKASDFLRVWVPLWLTKICLSPTDSF